MVQHFFILAAVASSQVGKQKRRHAVFFSYLNVYLGKEHHHHLQGVRLMLSVLLAQKHHDHAEFFPFGNGS